jgi:hypothetical protein
MEGIRVVPCNQQKDCIAIISITWIVLPCILALERQPLYLHKRAVGLNPGEMSTAVVEGQPNSAVAEPGTRIPCL